MGLTDEPFDKLSVLRANNQLILIIKPYFFHEENFINAYHAPDDDRWEYAKSNRCRDHRQQC